MSSINFKTLYNLPPLTTWVLLVNIFGSAFVYYLKYQATQILKEENKGEVASMVIPFFELVPSTVITHPWVLIVSSMIESSAIGIFFAIANTLVSVRYFERVWGTKEMAKYLVIITSLTNLLTCVTVILFSSADNLTQSVGGSFSLILGLIVGLKQMIPEHNLKFLQGLFHLRVKHVPFIVLLVTIVASFITQSYYPGVNSLLSFLLTWVYLRFYQSTVIEPLIPLTSDELSSTTQTQSNGVQRIRGDASDTFAFAYFFPDSIHKFISPVADSIYNLLTSAGLLPHFNEEDVIQSNERAAKRTSGGAGISSSSIAERRRQVALKVLEERIGDS